ncbi:MAG: hypothetical protein ACLTZI_02970 [[Eubacterium] siraeum]
MKNRDLTVGSITGGILFMLYGYYRAVNKPLMSVILTILSLGTRVLLAYILRERSRYRK